MPFKKGQSGNPNGAPRKEQTFSKALEEAVNNVSVNFTDPKTKEIKNIKGKEAVAQAYMDLAFNKKYPPAIRLRALDTIVERIDGKARENITLDGDVRTKTSLMDILDYRNMSIEQRKKLREVLETDKENE